MKRSIFLKAALGAFAAAGLGLSSVPAVAQSFPSKPIRLVVPYAPGGATDIIGRAAATELTRLLGKPVNVDNSPGAGGNLGAELVARAALDGHTPLLSARRLPGITPFLLSKLYLNIKIDL